MYGEKSGLEKLHYFSESNALFSTSKPRGAIDVKTVRAVNRESKQIIIPGFPTFPTLTHDIPNSEAPEIAASAVRFGAGSNNGFQKPSPFYHLPASRSESPTTRFGMGSVSAVRQKDHRKRRYNSSTLYCNRKESGFLIIPWCVSLWGQPMRSRETQGPDQGGSSDAIG